MTAINPVQCSDFPQACRAIQATLEHSPTLIYVPGRGFQHSFSTISPSPPNPPNPPPGLKFTQFNPPPPSSPPPSPPLYYAGADECMPIVSAIEAGFEVGDPTLPRDEDRSVCIFVRRILDERRETHDCFQVMPPAPPPPPPLKGADASVRRIDAYRQRLAQGETATDKLPPDDDATELQNEAFGSQAGVSALIASLAQDNPALATVLEGAITDLDTAQTTAGRRLFERAVDEDHVRLRDAWVASDLMRDGPLVGVTLSACGALCEALRRNDSSTDHRNECQGYAYRRLNPSDLTDFSVECHLLYQTGICTPIDFAATMYSRKYTSSGTCKNPTSYANPFCIELPASRVDSRVLDYESSHALCSRK